MTNALTALATTAATPGPHWDHGGGPGPWWPVFPILWFLFWAAIIVTAIVLWRRHRHERPAQSALSVLADEFARGNITEDEYEQRLSVLRRLRGR